MQLLERKSWDSVGPHGAANGPRAEEIPKVPNTAQSTSKHALGPGTSPALSCSPRDGLASRPIINRKLAFDSYCLSPFNLEKLLGISEPRACEFPLPFICSLSCPTPHPPATNTPPNTFKTNTVVHHGCRLIYPFELDL